MSNFLLIDPRPSIVVRFFFLQIILIFFLSHSHKSQWASWSTSLGTKANWFPSKEKANWLTASRLYILCSKWESRSSLSLLYRGSLGSLVVYQIEWHAQHRSFEEDALGGQLWARRGRAFKPRILSRLPARSHLADSDLVRQATGESER